jgi:hypothetical protein
MTHCQSGTSTAIATMRCFVFSALQLFLTLRRKKMLNGVGKKMPISRIVIAVPNATVVLLD